MVTDTNQRVLNTCRKCGYQWFTRKSKTPMRCSNCRSILWNRDRKSRNKSKLRVAWRDNRNNKIVAMRKSNPCMTLQEVGTHLGLTRERIRQILQSEGQPTRRYVAGRTWVCQKCGVTYHLSRHHTHHLYCPACKEIGAKIPVACDQCGKIKFMYAIQVLRKQATTGTANEHFFCDRHCYDKWRKGR